MTPLAHEDLEDYIDPFNEDCIDYADFDMQTLSMSDYVGDEAELLWRLQELKVLQEHYSDFRDFYHDVSVRLLGFEPTEMQYDIADYCQCGPQYSMIQAQRQEAKTTIAGAFAVWCLIHAPWTIILIVSAGGDMAAEVASWIIQIINGMDELVCLRPDRNHATTRTSLEKYDIHHLLKGPNKSPSIACIGITSNMQGKRAHLLISDDVESNKNSMTQTMRDQLLLKTKDFTSINASGKILYLGTPQSVDSIYNTLPGRGYDIRIWPGRYPTVEEEGNYNGTLAPYIVNRMQADPSLRTGGGPLGNRGKATDPGMLTEDALTNKETDQGAAYFNLQYMLDTALSDKNRYPLKLEDLMFLPLDTEEAPGKVVWGPRQDTQLPMLAGDPLKLCLYTPANVYKETYPYEGRLLAIDPAGEGGKNNDETGYSVIFTCNGYYFLMANGGIHNATNESNRLFWQQLMLHWGVNEVIVERNFGGGMFANYITGIVNSADIRASVNEVWSSGQKELRIIQSIDPIVSSHKLVINQSVLMSDFNTVQNYPVDLRNQYRMLFQFQKLTRDRGSLLHEDRIESIAIGLRHLKSAIMVDEDRKVAMDATNKMLNWMKNPKGITQRYPQPAMPQALGNVNAMNKYKR